MANSNFPSKDLANIIELWQEEECLWKISLEGYHKGTHLAELSD